MKMHSIGTYVLFMEAWILLHVMKVVILFIPFKKIAARLGNIQMESSCDHIVDVRLDQVWRAVHRAIRFTVHSSVCYDQALTAKFMLRRRNIDSTLYFGLAKDELGAMIAHAWVRCGDKIVTGKAGVERFTIVTSFT